MLSVVDGLLSGVGRIFKLKIVRFHHQTTGGILMMKTIFKNLSPFNNKMEMTGVEYTIKKLIAFFAIYIVSALIGGVIVMATLSALGYDISQSEMAEDEIVNLLPNYANLVFVIITIVYCRVIEKKKIQSLGINKKIYDYLTGTILAITLLFVIISVSCGLDAISYCGINKDVNVMSLMLWLLAFVIQGATEEIMTRGFLLKSLQKKIATPKAIIISSTAFTLLHLPSLLEADTIYVIVGVINLYLVSAIFSILVLLRGNIWIACGLHSVWNYILYSVMGLTVSGGENASTGVINFEIKETNIFNGAEYGIEASIITTVILGIVLIPMIKKMKGRVDKDGIK